MYMYLSDLIQGTPLSLPGVLFLCHLLFSLPSLPHPCCRAGSHLQNILEGLRSMQKYTRQRPRTVYTSTLGIGQRVWGIIHNILWQDTLLLLVTQYAISVGLGLQLKLNNITGLI